MEMITIQEIVHRWIAGDDNSIEACQTNRTCSSRPTRGRRRCGADTNLIGRSCSARPEMVPIIAGGSLWVAVGCSKYHRGLADQHSGYDARSNGTCKHGRAISGRKWAGLITGSTVGCSLRSGLTRAEPRRSRSGLWRVEPINKRDERVLEAWRVGVRVLPDEFDHLAAGFRRLLVFTANLIDHAEAVPAVGLLGEASQEIAGRDLCGVKLGRADEIDDGIGCVHQCRSNADCLRTCRAVRRWPFLARGFLADAGRRAELRPRT
jgi:hypothetical protein